MFNWIHHHAIINNIPTHYVEQGSGIPVILCHGFPHTWFSWHRQIPAIAAAGFRVIAPDMRGMGETIGPAEAQGYSVKEICQDLIGLLEHIGEEKAIFVGLDFGAFAMYDLAHLHPEKVIAVIGLENPAAPHNPEVPPLTEYAEMGKNHFLHINYFQEIGRADNDLAASPREFFRKVFWLLSGEGDYFETWKHPVDTTYIDSMPEPPLLPWPWLNELELEMFVQVYSKNGFTGGLNWYRSMDIKWQERKALEGKQSPIPAYFIGSEHDVDLEGFHGDDPISLMRQQFPDLRRVEMIPKAGHMIQLESSEEVNRLLLDYLQDFK